MLGRVGREEAPDVEDGEEEHVGDELVLLGDLDVTVDEDGALVGRHVGQSVCTASI